MEFSKKSLSFSVFVSLLTPALSQGPFDLDNHINGGNLISSIVQQEDKHAQRLQRLVQAAQTISQIREDFVRRRREELRGDKSIDVEGTIEQELIDKGFVIVSEKKGCKGRNHYLLNKY